MVNENGEIFDTKLRRSPCIWLDSTGYLHCRLRGDDNKKHDKRVHRLVAETLLSNPNNHPQVNHIDGNKENCKLSNLEWCTNSYNTQHGYDNKLYQFKSRSHAINIYTKEGEFIKTCKSIRSMCEEFKINRKTVTEILKGNKKTNNYDYLFEYVERCQEAIESIA